MTATETEPARTAPSATRPAPQSILRHLLALLGAMELSVGLLLYLLVLTFLGTIAQTRIGAYEVQRDYFESWAAPGIGPVRIPGGLPVMALLSVNLLVGGVMRLRWKLRNAGILTVHFGMLLLLLAAFVKYEFSFSGHLALFEGDASASFISFHEWELALVREDRERGVVAERTVPASRLSGAGRGQVEVAAQDLPFRVFVHHFAENCEPLWKRPMDAADTPVVDGAFLKSQPVNHKEREQNVAGCYVTVVDNATGERRDGILWAAERRPFDVRRYPFTFASGGATWGLDLRRVTWDLPFGVRLDRFSKRDHPGTSNPRDFSSYVTVLEGSAQRPVHIYMNNPLRKEGYVFYQTNWGPQDGSPGRVYSVFEVASNPSDQWPFWACWVIAAGLVAHFGTKLISYVRTQSRQRRQSMEAA